MDGLKTTAGTLALLALEDLAPDCLWETVSDSDVPLWLQVRMEFAMAMAETELRSIAVPRRLTRAKVLSRLARAHLPSRQDAALFRSTFDTLFLVSGVTTYVSGGLTHNWLIEDFVRALPSRSAVIQRRPLDGPRPAIADTRSFDSAEGRVDLSTRLRPASSETHSKIEGLVSEFARLLDADIPADRVAAISRAAQYQESRRPHLEREYERVLDRVRPRVVVMEDASYGSRAPYISLMKQRGIHVVEPQHGWIGPSHGAYNYGAAGSSKEFQAGLPDVLLTFGEYWNRGIRYPARAVAVGKPHLSVMSEGLPDYDSRPREVLVISSVADPEETVDLTLRLRDSLPPDWYVVFRPHPSERAQFHERYPRLVDAKRIRLDENLDVYDSLRQCRAVVGVASTVLYEAVAMGCHIFVQESVLASFMADSSLGQSFGGTTDLDRVVKKIVSGTPHSELDPEFLWAGNAAANFAKCLVSLNETHSTG